MVMELAGLGSTRWTSNSPRPFARSPGAGVGGLPMSGFSATPADIQGEDMYAFAKRWDFEVVRLPLEVGKIPSMLVQLRFTDRGTFAFAGQLDAQILPPLRAAGFKVSKATSFNPVAVSWKTQALSSDLYYPVVAAPPELAGIRYSGNAVTLPWTSTQAVDVAELGKLPSSLYIYTFAVTSKDNTMSDAQGAQVLSLVQNWKNSQPKAYATGKMTLLGSDLNVFERGGGVTPLAAGVGGLVLIVAWNLLSPHIKSGRV